MIRLLIVGVVFMVLGAAVVARPRLGIILTFVFLAVMGDFRRLIGAQAGFVQIDTILLIGPAIALLLFIMAFASGRVRVNSSLTKWIAALMALMFLQIFNPAQGGPMVGIFGAFFYIVPLLWFWIGNAFGSARTVERVALGTIVPLAVAASALGIYQAFFGALPFEMAWAKAKGYTALWVGDTIRPIGFFTSSAEFGHFLAIATILVWAAWLTGRRSFAILMPLFATAILLASMRGVVVSTFVAMTVLWAVQGRSRAVWLPRMIFAGAVGIAGLVFALTHLQSSSFQGSTATLVAHQTEGLLHPGDESVSTAGLHASMMIDGFVKGIEHPLGLGLGATSLAASMGGEAGGSTEIDLSNMMVSLGLFGGILYLGIILLALGAAVRLWLQTRDFAALAILGTLIALGGSWMNGGEYSVAALVWFLIGSVNRCSKELGRARAAAPRPRYA